MNTDDGGSVASEIVKGKCDMASNPTTRVMVIITCRDAGEDAEHSLHRERLRAEQPTLDLSLNE